MFNNLSLRIKIFALVSTVVLVSFLTRTIIITNKSVELVKTNAFNLAQETADRYKNEIIAELQGARITAETLSTVFESLKELNLTDREMMDDILKNALANKKYITAFCTAYELDALDGKDKEYAGVKPNYDESGRYAPYWNKLGESIAVEPLLDKDILAADWWTEPKRTKQEYIPDPYPYQVQGHDVILASLVFPIIYKDQFIGIISSDIVLDTLQKMVSAVNPNNEDGYTQIYSNSSVIVAHPNKPFLGKDISELLVYNMLTADRSKVKDAVKCIEEYLIANPLKDPNDNELTEKYDNSKKFLESLKEYGKNFDKEKLDVSLLNSELAESILKGDPRRQKHFAEAKEAIKNGKPYIYNGHYYYTVYMPVQFSEVTKPWSVAVSIPIAKVLDNANDIRNYALASSLIAVCVIACVLYVVVRNITKPIIELSDAAQTFGEGNFNVQVPVIRSNDEIGTLSKAFQFMAEKINHLITELQNDAKVLEEKNAYLNRLNELKDEFLANTSHELRTPINGIIGIVESMIDGATGSLSDEQKYNLAVVSNSGKRLSNMINDILDFTKLKNQEIVLQIKPTDLKTIVDTVVVLSKPLIKGKELSLVDEIEESLPLINADENRLQQILYNLFGNAIKFTEKGKVSISAKLTNNIVAVTVKDTGIGIAADKFERIFETFEQADGSTAREYGGTGLGLSITKKIVELQGGTINVESKVGEGSAFTFTVPVSDVKREEIASREEPKTIIDMDDYSAKGMTLEQEPENITKEGGYKILVVDDEPVNIQVLMNLLSIRNYSVFKAYNGLAALELFDKGGEFDLVLLDVMMPKMSGYEVCRKLREKHSLFDLPIIMLTAKNQVRDIVLGFQSGANDYVQKPFDKEELLARVRTLLELKGAMTAALAATKAKSLFLTNMSHELRTPLNAVIGLSALLLKTQMDDTQRDYMGKMRHASSSLLGIINNILDFSKAEAGNMKLVRVPFDIRSVFDDIIVFFKEQNSESGIPLRFELDNAIPATLLGDPLRLQQVFVNLVDNAYKFTEKGSITVRAAVAQQNNNSGLDNVTLNFAVEDTGIGMNPKQTEEIFADFNQGDNSSTRKYGGVGIGLTITKQIISLMGGEIAVSSQEGKGTTFTFSCSFPLVGVNETIKETRAVPPASSSVSLTNVADPNEQLRGLRVLLVEDNKVNALVAAQLMKSVGVEVAEAQNGKEALDQLAEAAKANAEHPFDLILMDLQMPVMDGYEATQVIKDTPEYKNIPILALTAHALPEERDRCFALGMQDHLTKPIDVDSFYKTLRDAAAATATTLVTTT